jgi:PAS domain S-box-containing protein
MAGVEPRKKDPLVRRLRAHELELERQNRELRDVQRALEQSRHRFEELYDLAPVAYSTFDREGCILEINLAGASMLGRERTAILGLPLLELVEVEAPDIFRAHLRRCMSERAPVTTEMRWSDARGDPHHIQLVSTPELDARGAAVAFRTSFVDVTECRRVEEELARARGEEERTRKRFEALDHAAVCLNQSLGAQPNSGARSVHQVIVDEARRMVDADYAAIGIGEDPERPFTLWVFSGVDPSRAALIGRVPRPRALLGELARSGRTIMLRDVREHPLSAGLPPHHPEMRSLLGVPVVCRGKPVGSLYVANKRGADAFRDDDRRVLEMFAMRAGLAMEVALLNDEVRDAVRTRDNLLAVVAHDLRSPLQAILMGASLLESASPSSDASKSRRQLEVIARSATRMNQLLDDLLAAATLDAGTFTVEPEAVEAGPVVEESVLAMEAIAAARSIRLTWFVASDLPPMRADRRRVMQVLQNLVGNALKFTPEKGSVGLRVWHEEETVRFSVADTGPGIERELLPHLFDRYWKGKAERRRGVGLGLYIAKGIVEAHGGNIEVATEAGAGTTFTFTIPTTQATEAPLGSRA